MKSWKTSLAGALVIIAAVLGVAFGRIDPVMASPLIFVGIGLIMARDNNVTSEQAGAKRDLPELVATSPTASAPEGTRPMAPSEGVAVRKPDPGAPS